jgi:hypothetical protein
MSMRPIPFVAVLLIAATAATKADLTIIQKTEGTLNSGQLTLRIKGDKARTDIAPQITMLTEMSSGDSTTINHNAKTYMRIPGTEAAKLRAMAADLKPGATADAPKLTNTGRKEKIENRECEIFTWGVGNLQVTDWIARDYPNWQPILAELVRFQNAGLGAAAQPLMPALDQFPGMVMKREMTLKGTKTTSTLLSVSDAALDAKLFELPEGYREQPAPKFPDPAPAPAPSK